MTGNPLVAVGLVVIGRNEGERQKCGEPRCAKRYLQTL